MVDVEGLDDPVRRGVVSLETDWVSRLDNGPVQAVFFGQDPNTHGMVIGKKGNEHGEREKRRGREGGEMFLSLFVVSRS